MHRLAAVLCSVAVALSIVLLCIGSLGAQTTPNYIRRTGDIMTGVLILSGGGTKGELQFVPQLTAPTNPTTGTVYHDYTANTLLIWDGTAWVGFSGGTPGADGHGSTITAAPFTVPAVGSTVTVNVTDGVAIPDGSFVYITDGTHSFVGQVASGGLTTTLTVTNDGPTGSAALGVPGPTGPTGATGTNGGGYIATSATSHSIGTGSQAFITQSGLAYIAGDRVRFVSAADSTNYEEGLCTAYVGTTLTATIDVTGGSGTHTDWGLSVSGNVGLTGATGATGATGPTGPTGATGATGPGYLATSTTSHAIASSGSQTFTTQSGLAYIAGDRVRFVSAANSANYEEGLCTSYSSTSLIVTMDVSGGSGTHTDWNISLSGNVGLTGSTGAAGATGATGSAGAAGANGGGAGAYRNLMVLFADTASVSITCDGLDVLDASNNITTLYGVSLNPSITAANGALALDTGTVTIDKKYAEWVLEKSDKSASTAVFSLSSTLAGLTLPAGYTGCYARRVGWCFTAHTTAAIISFQQLSSWLIFNVNYSTATTSDGCNILANGTATSFTAQSLAARMPSTSRLAILYLESTTSSTASLAAADFRATGSTATPSRAYYIQFATAYAIDVIQRNFGQTNAAQSIDYKNDGTNPQLSVGVVGYEDNL